uniref:Uncharacterized protein n=1 Tax=Ascaris lumbricoides TaxID=6252 RepID=A0A0M3HMN1_ASCLU
MSKAKVNDVTSEGDHLQKEHVLGTCMPTRSTLDDNDRLRIQFASSHPVCFKRFSAIEFAVMLLSEAMDHPVIERGPFMTLEQALRVIKLNGGVGRGRRPKRIPSSSRQPWSRFFTDEEIARKKLFDETIRRQPDADRGVLRQVIGFTNTDDIDEILELYCERMKQLRKLE